MELSSIQPLDLTRMFLGTQGQQGWLFLLEVVFRTVFMFVWTVVNVRYLGKRNMSQLTPYQFILAFALGSSVGDPMFYPQVPLFHGMMVITLIVSLEKLLSWILERNQQLERFVEGEPALVILHGQIQTKVMKEQNLSEPQLLMRLRQEGIENVGVVKYGFLETSGRLSVIEANKGERTRGKETTKKVLKQELGGSNNSEDRSKK